MGHARPVGGEKSGENVRDEVRRRWPEVRLIASERNLGFGGGCNLALGDLESVDLVALVNNDADVPPDWLEPLRDEIQRGDRIGAACPRILLDGRFLEV